MADIILFDLDGTLTDPKSGITRSIRHALEKLNVAAPPEDELTWCIGPPLRASLAKIVGDHQADQALMHYRERFSVTGLFENSLYPGIPELLKSLSGKRLFVATSKPTVFAHRILEHFGIAPYFEKAYGSELDGTRTNKGELIGHLLAKTGINPTDAVMVGDRSHDIVGARQNGMRGLGVSYGYGGEAELREAGAVAIFATVGDLKTALLNA